MKFSPIIPILAALLVAACGGSSTDSSQGEANRSEPDLPGSGYDRALERANAVEQDVLDAAQRQRDQIEEQEGGN
jgi:hypothetical protein